MNVSYKLPDVSVLTTMHAVAEKDGTVFIENDRFVIFNGVNTLLLALNLPLLKLHTLFNLKLLFIKQISDVSNMFTY